MNERMEVFLVLTFGWLVGDESVISVAVMWRLK